MHIPHVRIGITNYSREAHNSTYFRNRQVKEHSLKQLKNTEGKNQAEKSRLFFRQALVSQNILNVCKSRKKKQLSTFRSWGVLDRFVSLTCNFQQVYQFKKYINYLRNTRKGNGNNSREVSRAVFTRISEIHEDIGPSVLRESIPIRPRVH